MYGVSHRLDHSISYIVPQSDKTAITKLINLLGTLHPFHVVTSTYTLVRIKDKFAVYYPIIGIGLELVVLAILIYCCERGKGGSGGGDELNSVGDDEDNVGYKSGGKNGASSVRHRRA